MAPKTGKAKPHKAKGEKKKKEEKGFVYIYIICFVVTFCLFLEKKERKTSHNHLDFAFVVNRMDVFSFLRVVFCLFPEKTKLNN